MPGYNQRGPSGAGPMTGRGKGYCNSVNSGYGRQLPVGAEFGRSGRRGCGLRGGFGPGGRRFADFRGYSEDIAGEINRLKIHAESIGKMLDAVNRRLSTLENSEAANGLPGNP